MCVSSTNIDPLHFNDNDKRMIASLIFIRPICDDSSGAETICEGRSCAKVSSWLIYILHFCFLQLYDQRNKEI